LTARRAFLLDTHALFWAIIEPDNLAAGARAILEDPSNAVFATLASAQEIAMKISANKWPEARDLLAGFQRLVVDEAGFNLVAPTAADYLNMTRLPDVDGHRDPLDRLIIAMAIARGLILVSSDDSAQAYPVQRIAAGRRTGPARPRSRTRIMPAEPLLPIPLDL
jgi:PIN domain nuclease of toxin-antitoxin system